MDQSRRERFVRVMVLLNLVALVGAYMGGQWDAAMHARGEVDRFWYPPHYGIYFAIFTAAILSGLGLIVLVRSRGAQGGKVRGNAALALLVIANTLGFTGAPFDAWWHQTYGTDLSVWSPPHFHLLAGMVIAALACCTFFLDRAPEGVALRALRPVKRTLITAVLALAIALLLASFVFFEYEAGLANAEVRSRPPWTYPVIWTAFATFAVSLPLAVLRVKGAATVVTAAYLLARFEVLAVDRQFLGFAGAIPYPLIFPAVAFDVAMALGWPYTVASGLWKTVAASGLLASAVVILTAPPFWSAVAILPELNASPWASYWPAALAAGVPSSMVGWWAGTALRKLRPDGHPSVEPKPATVAIN